MKKENIIMIFIFFFLLLSSFVSAGSETPTLTPCTYGESSYTNGTFGFGNCSVTIVIVYPTATNRFECNLQNLQTAILIIGVSLFLTILWILSFKYKTPFLFDFLLGLVLVYWSWYIASCFFLANVLFIFLGIATILNGIIKAIHRNA